MGKSFDIILSKKPDKFEYEDEIYYYLYPNFVTKGGIIVDGYLAQDLAKYYFSLYCYQDMDRETLVDFINAIDNLEYPGAIKNICEYAIKTYAYYPSVVRRILPIYTSMCRKLNQSEIAIKTALEFIKVNINSNSSIIFDPYSADRDYESAALYTSLAAAYCDEYERYGDYCLLEVARKCANKAYMMLRGKTDSELRCIYSRINCLEKK